MSVSRWSTPWIKCLVYHDLLITPMEPKLLEFTRRRGMNWREVFLHSQKEMFSPRESAVSVVFRLEKDAIPYNEHEVNSVRNLRNAKSFSERSFQACLTGAFALLLVPAMALGQTFVQNANNAPPQAMAQVLPSRTPRLPATLTSSWWAGVTKPRQ